MTCSDKNDHSRSGGGLTCCRRVAEVTAYPPGGVQMLVGRTALCMSAEEKEGEARG